MKCIFPYYRFRVTRIVLILILFATFTGLKAQDENKTRETVSVTIKVTDESGNPLAGSKLVVGEGSYRTETDANGMVTFNAHTQDFVNISSSSFEKLSVLVLDLLQNSTVVLKQSKLFMTSDDEVPLPFTVIKKRNLTSNNRVIKGEMLHSYPATDIRNAFTGLVPGVEVRELCGQPGVSALEYLGLFGAAEKVNLTSRGRSLSYVIDDIPTNPTEMPLDPDEIESVTFINSIIGKAMYGPLGADGIVFITTKRGMKNERVLNINLESGVGVVDRMPELVSGADYARLNNMARFSSGLPLQYNDLDIEEYEKNDAGSLTNPSINFMDEMLKKTKGFRRASLSSSGGNDIVQYFSYLGFTGEGDIYKLGATADYNRINTRQNIDVKINDIVNVKFDFYGNLTYRRSPNYGFNTTFTESSSVLNLIELPAVLSDIRSIPPVAFPTYAAFDTVKNIPWYGISNNYKQNPIGNLVEQGYYTETGRSGAANISLGLNFDKYIKGLKSSTHASFSIFNLTRIGKQEDYIARIVESTLDPATGLRTAVIKTSTDHVGYSMSDQTRLMEYYFQSFAIYENLSYNRRFGDHTLQSNLVYYLSKTFRDGITQPQRTNTSNLSVLYTFKDKYSIHGLLDYSGTTSFEKENRFGIFPAVGASWIVSDESFLSGSSFIDFLKLRIEGGVIGNESFLSPYYYLDNWSGNTSGTTFGPVTSGSTTWFGTTTSGGVHRTTPSRIGNPDLTWEVSEEINAGFDLMILDKKLLIEASYYNHTYDGQIVQISNAIPYLAGLSGARPFLNYAKTQYFGFDAGITYTESKGDLHYSIALNGIVQNSKRIKYDEPNYRFDYQKRTGLPVDAYFGQTYLGKFTSDTEYLLVPQLYDDVLKTGDLKYNDMNEDGVIDDNDMSMIGHTSPRLYYSLYAKIGYKGFDMTFVGAGRAFFDIPLTNSYYWNGWGDNTYSTFVRDNIDGAYPGLTYNRVNNNFVASEFWLAKGDFFKIQNIELAYTIPSTALTFIGGKSIRVYVRGANLLTISGIKDLDPESMSSGVTDYPLFRTFTGGLKFNF